MNDLISIDWINTLNAKMHVYDYFFWGGGGLRGSLNNYFSQNMAIFVPKFCCFSEEKCPGVLRKCPGMTLSRPLFWAL